MSLGRSSSRGSCDRLSNPNTRSNSGVVRYLTAPPVPSSRPASVIRPRSTKPATAESAATPRMRAISGRVHGPRYATIATVSSAACDSAPPATRAPSRRAHGRRPPRQPARRRAAARSRRRAAPRASARAGRAGWRRLGGAGVPRNGPFVHGRAFLLHPSDADGSERRRLADRDLVRAAQLEQRQEGDRLLGARQPCQLGIEVEAEATPQERAEALEELRHGREAKLHVCQRHRRRLCCEQAENTRQGLWILRREPPFRLGSQRSRPKPEEPVALPG